MLDKLLEGKDFKTTQVYNIAKDNFRTAAPGGATDYKLITEYLLKYGEEIPDSLDGPTWLERMVTGRRVSVGYENLARAHAGITSNNLTRD